MKHAPRTPPCREPDASNRRQQDPALTRLPVALNKSTLANESRRNQRTAAVYFTLSSRSAVSEASSSWLHGAALLRTRGRG